MLLKNSLVLNCSLDRIEELIKRFAPSDPLSSYLPHGTFKLHKSISKRDRNSFYIFRITGNYESVDDHVQLTYRIYPVWWEWITSALFLILWVSSIFISLTNPMGIYAIIGFSMLNLFHYLNLIWQINSCKNRFEDFLTSNT